MNQAARNTLRKKQLSHLTLATTGILTIPLIAMAFNSTTNWGLGDFLAAATLLFGSGLLYILVATKLQSKRAKLLVGFIILIILAIIWAELAVGIFS